MNRFGYLEGIKIVRALRIPMRGEVWKKKPSFRDNGPLLCEYILVTGAIDGKVYALDLLKAPVRPPDMDEWFAIRQWKNIGLEENWFYDSFEFYSNRPELLDR